MTVMFSIPVKDGHWWDTKTDATGYDWSGHPECESIDEDERSVIDARLAGELEFISGASDPEASYSYDEYSLVKHGDIYYLLATSGCSCPSPSETWYVCAKSDNIREALTPIANAKSDGLNDFSINWARDIIAEHAP
jgi:hypothetical protein